MAVLILMAQIVALGAPEGLPFDHTQNVVYGEAHGVGLLMDVFVPRGEKNGAAVIDVVSGAWYSDREKLVEHWAAGMYELHCAKGFTVFAVRPGSVSHFTGEEMIGHIRTALDYVREHADEYGVDPSRIGLVGASAGGHLAALAAVTATPKTQVQAVAVFFPPTDFLDWEGNGDMPDFEEISPLFFEDGVEGHSEDEVKAKARALSPARQVGTNVPQFLLIHGDADTTVPLFQSQTMIAALERAGGKPELIVKPGGEHPWPTIREEVAVMAEWMARQLGAAAAGR
ncbi:MAG TPA: alpha/beta hydrolase [Candidatus Hydrogenedentes bacterium]|nr:alpha/beta hydrolase [Candidatus Hydrogenedentota bacterium]HQM49906.1 alpha/beta hydrolase [Candidatus Hydrogenedentota bacterium]